MKAPHYIGFYAVWLLAKHLRLVKSDVQAGQNTRQTTFLTYFTPQC
jgi:hypothetical protein